MKKSISSFEDLIIWQKAQDLAVKIYHLVDENIHIRKDFELRGQLKSSSISISDNIAEGFEYNNNPDFHRFLRIAKGSCGEVRNKVLFIKRMNYIDENEATRLAGETFSLGKQIGELMKRVKEKINQSRTSRHP